MSEGDLDATNNKIRKMIEDDINSGLLEELEKDMDEDDQDLWLSNC